VARFDLTDFEWSVIEPLLPTKVRGVARVDDRRVLNGIFWRLRTGGTLGRYSGAPWPAYDLREPLQPLAQGRSLGADIASCVSSLPRRDPDDRLLVHPRPPARFQRPEKDGRSRCMGRSGGGLTTKIHALVDALGLPIGLKLTEGQAHDGRSADDMLDGLGEGCVLLADRAYDSDAMRNALAVRGAWACVKPMPNRKRIPAFSPFLYRYRNLVERFFSKLKYFRAVATRYDKRDDNFLASVQLASIRIWLRHNESVT
jgi:transposase